MYFILWKIPTYQTVPQALDISRKSSLTNTGRLQSKDLQSKVMYNQK